MSFDLKISGGDFIISNGDLKKVINTEKLIQDILKICLTKAGANPLNPWYGSFIYNSIIGTAQDPGLLIQIGKSQLSTALDNLKNLQTAQVKSFQRVSPDEQIGAISNISITNNNDPRAYNISISCLTKGFNKTNATFVVSL